MVASIAAPAARAAARHPKNSAIGSSIARVLPLRGEAVHVKPSGVQRIFTLAQANVLVPRLVATLRRTSQLALQLSALTRKNDPQNELQVRLLQELLAQETQGIERLG